MARRDVRHGRRRARLLPLVALVCLALAAAGAWRYDVLDRWLAPGRPADPAAIAPPDELTLPAVVEPPTVADEPAGGPLGVDTVRRAIAPRLRDEDLGRHVLAAVGALDGAGVLVRTGTGSPLAVPASTTKVVTAVAALLAMAPDTTFRTRVVDDGPRGIVLVGGGDPLLASEPASPREEPAWPARADVTTLARETADALAAEGRTRVRVGYDTSLFTGPAANPRWRADYVPDGVVSPITALWVDEGRPAEGFGRVEDPALTAATVFAGELSRRGIRVVGIPRERVAAEDAAELAAVAGAQLGQVVEHVLQLSDNEAAEVLLRHVGLAAEGEGSSEAGRRGVVRLLDEAGVDLGRTRLWDGSGLSRQNRMEPAALLDVIRLAASDERPELRAVLTGLPVAGFTGSLTDRFGTGAPEGRGRVRAKTGTLTGVTSLAGLAVDRTGRTMVFAMFADRVRVEDTIEARDAMDAAAAALGACRCG
ncbi:D-alanyl-D-alanine carboxypeptidase/D-alanyl-D-alanine-endopeptidase [Nocardioides sp. SOB77]|uniref:D-alanyl-D-alanine carboxypeptidase/D-alanyl-D-alanine-endopeptidase n=1 Tax=Nocardioides oceani TaxID=3058369 RepID=A0ABT8FCC3_9ACTN|nr:D-alanyl-D-alanine carboxypeptidase/D-alanyl-D-alanine-endopeptidase [Nocardioides oceani]MDN4171822.1 D-alanyl-D-alanine carboxypeptidase/D-alanyl-D-alanine-endopeptidase [Nocardioides oceani]